MASRSNTGQEPGVINEQHDGSRDFLIRSSNDDLFMRTGKQIIEHCRLGISVETWMKEVHDLFGQVQEWCEKRHDKVRCCYAAPTAKVTLFFIPTSEAYDFDLGEDLANLTVTLVQNYNVGMIETRQVPWSERERFIRDESSRAIYGQPPGHVE